MQERRLEHREEAEKFYRELATQRASVRVGMEASGHARWFERLLGELGMELWIGDAAKIGTKRVRKQKTDRQDAELILRLLLEDRFPRIWVPSWENRDLRQLLWHRHRMVLARTRIMNQLQAVALNEGLRCKKRLWAGRGGRAIGVVPLRTVGKPTPAGPAGVVGPTDSDHCRVDASRRTGSGEMSRGAGLEDTSRSGGTDSAAFCADHRQSGAISVWQADRELSGAGAVRGVEAGIGDGWDTSRNRVTLCCVFFRWKRRR